MSHEIENAHLAERASAIFSAREGAGWTGLGRAIPAEIAKDPAKLAEFLGATWRVVTQDVFTLHNGVYVKADDIAAQVRSDSGRVLGITSQNRYHTDNRHPADIFEAFRDELAANNLEISHAAILKNGEIVAVSALLSADHDLVIGKDDRIKRYVTLSTAYNTDQGTRRTEGKVRVVCYNTWQGSLSEAKASGKIATIRASTRIEAGQLAQLVGDRSVVDGPEEVIEETAKDVAAVLRNIERRARREEVVYNELANRILPPAEIARYFADVLAVNIADLNAVDSKGKPKVSSRTKNIFQELLVSYRTAPGAQPGTAWGALNAVTHYATHVKTTRDVSGQGSENAWVSSNLFGDAARLKDRGLQLLVGGSQAAAEQAYVAEVAEGNDVLAGLLQAPVKAQGLRSAA